jgi:hypothetical protein
VAAGRPAQLDDPRRARDKHEECAGHGGQQQGHAEWQVAVGTEVADVGPLPVFQYEHEQKQQHDGGQSEPYPDSADPGATDDMLTRRVRRGRGGRSGLNLLTPGGGLCAGLGGGVCDRDGVLGGSWDGGGGDGTGILDGACGGSGSVRTGVRNDARSGQWFLGSAGDGDGL